MLFLRVRSFSVLFFFFLLLELCSGYPRAVDEHHGVAGFSPRSTESGCSLVDGDSTSPAVPAVEPLHPTFQGKDVAHQHVKSYDWTLTYALGAPNGHARKMIFTNGQFPGPTIIVNEGDTIEVTVHNKMPFNTTIHWHGMIQSGTPWSDGVPGVNQKPIEPGTSFVYRFVAAPYGTYWWHSHSRATLMDGLYGVLHVKPSASRPDPFSLISKDAGDLQAMRRAVDNPTFVMVSDWNHLNSQDYYAAEEASGLDLFCQDSVLINGKGAVICKSPDYFTTLEGAALKRVLDGHNLTDRGCFPPDLSIIEGNFPFDFTKEKPYQVNEGCAPSDGGQSVFQVDPSQKWVSFNFINSASQLVLGISIDEHEMWVYAVDGEYIIPQLTTDIASLNGERYSALVKLNKTPGDYTMRVPDNQAVQIVSGFATVSYKGRHTLNRASIPWVDYAGVNTTTANMPMNNSIIQPFPTTNKPSPTADATHVMNLDRFGAAYLWTLDGKALYAPDRNAYNPILYNLGAASDPNLFITTKNNTWVDIIFQTISDEGTPIEPVHVMHKHSNKAYIIGRGVGPWTWSSVAEAAAAGAGPFNFENPPYRDTFDTAFGGTAWLAIRYHVVNPGPFLIHCHVEMHLAGGMAMTIVDGIDKLPINIPQYYVSKSGPGSPNGTLNNNM